MKKLFLLFIVLLLMVSCEKEEQVIVEYRVSNAYAETEISYKSMGEDLKTEIIDFQSGEDTWNYSLEMEPGQIIYLSAVYQDSASSVNLQIVIDGKVYKEGSNVNEPEKYLVVSGTIPY